MTVSIVVALSSITPGETYPTTQLSVIQLRLRSQVVLSVNMRSIEVLETVNVAASPSTATFWDINLASNVCRPCNGGLGYGQKCG